jgi:hypothetical protein
MKFVIEVMIDVKNEDQAEVIRSEIAMALEDARDSEELSFKFEADVGSVKASKSTTPS